MLDSISLSNLLITLVVLVFVSAFFSAAETAMMALNRYRLRHLVKKGHRLAALVQTLLKRPDRLLGVILIGNNCANIFASSIATIIGVRLYGEAGVPIAAGILTFIVLIFSEITPKTLAAIYPQNLSFFAAAPLWVLLRILYPVVWLGNTISNGILRLFRVKAAGAEHHMEQLTHEELRTLLHELGSNISKEDQAMLLSILELRNVTVEDIMTPKDEIQGIDLEDDFETICEVILETDQSQVLVYRGYVDQICGILNTKKAAAMLADEELNKASLEAMLIEPYFIPKGATLASQLLHFRKKKRYTALIVDEYGEILGLVNLGDILEEIVGEFIVDADMFSDSLYQQPDGSYLVDGSMTIHELNRLTGWSLDAKGPKTLSGLIVEKLEMIPPVGTCLKIKNIVVEVVRTHLNRIKTVRLFSLTKK